MHDRDKPSATQRTLALMGGPFYLFLLTAVFQHATRASLALTAAVVVGCAILVLVSIGLLCVRFARRRESGSQFGMATALLLFIPFSVYLGAIRCLMMTIETERVGPIMWVPFGVFCLMFMVLTTMILLHFGEALVWLAMSIRNASRGRVSDGLREWKGDTNSEEIE